MEHARKAFEIRGPLIGCRRRPGHWRRAGDDIACDLAGEGHGVETITNAARNDLTTAPLPSKRSVFSGGHICNSSFVTTILTLVIVTARSG
jgi:hypothetical protein